MAPPGSRATSTPPTPGRRWRRCARLAAVVSEGEPDGHGGLFVEVQGAGLRGAAPAEIDVGNAGTLLRIMPGWLAGQPRGEWTLDGDESIRRRPVDRVADPLRLMGAEVECREGRLPPLRVRGAPLRGIDLRAADGERPGEVLPSARRAPGRRRDDGPRAGPDQGPHRADAGRGGRQDSPERGGADGLSGRAARIRRRAGSRRLLLGRLLHRRRPDRSRQRAHPARGRVSTPAGSACSPCWPGWESRWVAPTPSGPR